ncbi:hypothetical protein [Methylobacterium radiotolerans]|uniref:hypothetical protein n=1 Tax=Methylobacterium radiotolerans TaxID=31998 RepID=UPI0011155056|nr:hypothetical protein [Methylobacterium radiotolerans]
MNGPSTPRSTPRLSIRDAIGVAAGVVVGAAATVALKPASPCDVAAVQELDHDAKQKAQISKMLEEAKQHEKQ